MTVLGTIPADDLGITVTHEHIFVDLTCWLQPPKEATRQALVAAPVEMRHLDELRRDPRISRDNLLLDDFDVAVEEVNEFVRLGGGTIVDVSLADIGRDPLALQAVSRATGVKVVAGCGHYVYLSHPRSLADEPEESIAERLTVELTEGIGTTGIRAGIIGEIGTSDPLHPDEEKVLRAAARAQKATGVAVTIHLQPPNHTGHEILTILEEAGADPARVVMGHLDPTIDDTLEYHRSLADRGCFIEYDTCGFYVDWPGLGAGGGFTWPSDRARAAAIASLFDAGYGRQVLIAQDICKKIDLVRYGGPGYGHIPRTFSRYLRDAGLGEVELEQILVHNPRRMLVPHT
jgi:phosphotriesterase-related protein